MSQPIIGKRERYANLTGASGGHIRKAGVKSGNNNASAIDNDRSLREQLYDLDNVDSVMGPPPLRHSTSTNSFMGNGRNPRKMKGRVIHEIKSNANNANRRLPPLLMNRESNRLTVARPASRKQAVAPIPQSDQHHPLYENPIRAALSRPYRMVQPNPSTFNAPLAKAANRYIRPVPRIDPLLESKLHDLDNVLYSSSKNEGIKSKESQPPLKFQKSVYNHFGLGINDQLFQVPGANQLDAATNAMPLLPFKHNAGHHGTAKRVKKKSSSKAPPPLTQPQATPSSTTAAQPQSTGSPEKNDITALVDNSFVSRNVSYMLQVWKKGQAIQQLKQSHGGQRSSIPKSTSEGAAANASGTTIDALKKRTMANSKNFGSTNSINGNAHGRQSLFKGSRSANNSAYLNNNNNASGNAAGNDKNTNENSMYAQKIQTIAQKVLLGRAGGTHPTSLVGQDENSGTAAANVATSDDLANAMSNDDDDTSSIGSMVLELDDLMDDDSQKIRNALRNDGQLSGLICGDISVATLQILRQKIRKSLVPLSPEDLVRMLSETAGGVSGNTLLSTSTTGDGGASSAAFGHLNPSGNDQKTSSSEKKNNNESQLTDENYWYNRKKANNNGANNASINAKTVVTDDLLRLMLTGTINKKKIDPNAAKPTKPSTKTSDGKQGTKVETPTIRIIQNSSSMDQNGSASPKLNPAGKTSSNNADAANEAAKAQKDKKRFRYFEPQHDTDALLAATSISNSASVSASASASHSNSLIIKGHKPLDTTQPPHVQSSKVRNSSKLRNFVKQSDEDEDNENADENESKKQGKQGADLLKKINSDEDNFGNIPSLVLESASSSEGIESGNGPIFSASVTRRRSSISSAGSGAKITHDWLAQLLAKRRSSINQRKQQFDVKGLSQGNDDQQSESIIDDPFEHSPMLLSVARYMCIIHNSSSLDPSSTNIDQSTIATFSKPFSKLLEDIRKISHYLRLKRRDKNRVPLLEHSAFDSTSLDDLHNQLSSNNLFNRSISNASISEIDNKSYAQFTSLKTGISANSFRRSSVNIQTSPTPEDELDNETVFAIAQYRQDLLKALEHGRLQVRFAAARLLLELSMGLDEIPAIFEQVLEAPVQKKSDSASAQNNFDTDTVTENDQFTAAFNLSQLGVFTPNSLEKLFTVLGEKSRRATCVIEMILTQVEDADDRAKVLEALVKLIDHIIPDIRLASIQLIGEMYRQHLDEQAYLRAREAAALGKKRNQGSVSSAAGGKMGLSLSMLAVRANNGGNNESINNLQLISNGQSNGNIFNSTNQTQGNNQRSSFSEAYNNNLLKNPPPLNKKIVMPDSFYDEMMPKLVQRLWTDWSIPVREACSYTLSHVGHGEYLLRSMISRLEGTNFHSTGKNSNADLNSANEKIEVLRVMGKLKVLTKKLLRAYLSTFSDINVSVRIQACKTASSIGSNHSSIINALIEKSDDFIPKVRAYAIRALGAIKCQDEKVINCIRWLLEHETNPTVRMQTCEAVVDLKLPIAASDSNANVVNNSANTNTNANSNNNNPNSSSNPGDRIASTDDPVIPNQNTASSNNASAAFEEKKNNNSSTNNLNVNTAATSNVNLNGNNNSSTGATESNLNVSAKEKENEHNASNNNSSNNNNVTNNVNLRFKSPLFESICMLMHAIAFHDPVPMVRDCAESCLRKLDAFRIEYNTLTVSSNNNTFNNATSDNNNTSTDDGQRNNSDSANNNNNNQSGANGNIDQMQQQQQQNMQSHHQQQQPLMNASFLDPNFFTDEATVLRAVKELTTKDSITHYIMSV